MNKLFLVRHGENRANITKEFSHKKVDYPLTEKGVLQAGQTALYFREKGLTGIFSSPLKRAVQTAEIIGEEVGLPVTIVENFREVNVGDMEDWPPTDENWAYYMEIQRGWYRGAPDRTFPGGENRPQLEARLREGIERVLDDPRGERAVIVAHGGVFMTLLRDICRDLHPDAFKELHYHNCAVSEIDIRREDGRLSAGLVGLALCDHLSGEAAKVVHAVPESVLETSDSRPKQP